MASLAKEFARYEPQPYIKITAMYDLELGKLRKDLESHPEINVRTCDLIQGREEEIIVVHLSAAFEAMECINPLGFINDLKRLNVAMTRAKNYMFVVGNTTHGANRSSHTRTIGRSTPTRILKAGPNS